MAGGRVVKGVNFVDLVDAGDPVEAAIAYDAAGADELTFLDITASSEGRDATFDMISRTAERCFMPLTVGGGVRTVADIRKLLLAGADKVSINTTAVNNPDFVAEAADKFGNQCIVVAIDAKQAVSEDGPDRWEIFTHGGRNATGIDAVEFARLVVEKGAGEILLTDIDRDGSAQGYDLETIDRVANAVVIAATPRLSAQNIAFNEVARQAIRSDPDFFDGWYAEHNTVKPYSPVRWQNNFLS